jgi:NAD(P)H-dependent FMN reductase/ribosomal protein S18 acetylase RimI-like enzyme
MSTNKSRIMVLACSTRPGALAPAVADWFMRAATPHAQTLDVELVPVSLADLDLPFLDEPEHPASGVYRQPHSLAWSALVDGVDGFVFVTPEYNHGMPAVLKNALDYLGREWAWKPAGFVSYGHTSAGTRSVQHARQVVSALRLVPTGATVSLRIGDAIVEGQVRQDERLDGLATRLLGEVVRLGHALRPMREPLAGATQAGPVAGSHVRRLTPADAADAIVLQRCCWVDEALANQTLDIPALHEDLDDVRNWLGQWTALGLWRDGKLLGMVRARRDGDTWNIGRLAVAPHMRGTGVGRWLLRHVEGEAEPACIRATLETGARSAQNIRLYLSEGFEHIAGMEGGDVVHLAKPLREKAMQAGIPAEH